MLMKLHYINFKIFYISHAIYKYYKIDRKYLKKLDLFENQRHSYQKVSNISSVRQQATPRQNPKIRSAFVERTFRQSLRRSMHISTHDPRESVAGRFIHFVRSDARNVRSFVPRLEADRVRDIRWDLSLYTDEGDSNNFKIFPQAWAKSATVTHLHTKSSFRSVYLAVFCSASVLRDFFPASSCGLTLSTFRASFLSRFYFGNEENAIDRSDQHRHAFTGGKLAWKFDSSFFRENVTLENWQLSPHDIVPPWQRSFWPLDPISFRPGPILIGRFILTLQVCYHYIHTRNWLQVVLFIHEGYLYYLRQYFLFIPLNYK